MSVFAASMLSRDRATEAMVSAGDQEPWSYNMSRQMWPAREALRNNTQGGRHTSQHSRTVAVDVRVLRRWSKEDKLGSLHGELRSERHLAAHAQKGVRLRRLGAYDNLWRRQARRAVRLVHACARVTHAPSRRTSRRCTARCLCGGRCGAASALRLLFQARGHASAQHASARHEPSSWSTHSLRGSSHDASDHRSGGALRHSARGFVCQLTRSTDTTTRRTRLQTRS